MGLRFDSTRRLIATLAAFAASVAFGFLVWVIIILLGAWFSPAVDAPDSNSIRVDRDERASENWLLAHQLVEVAIWLISLLIMLFFAGPKVYHWVYQKVLQFLKVSD